jgi:hypothetical protein
MPYTSGDVPGVGLTVGDGLTVGEGLTLGDGLTVGDGETPGDGEGGGGTGVPDGTVAVGEGETPMIWLSLLDEQPTIASVAKATPQTRRARSLKMSFNMVNPLNNLLMIAPQSHLRERSLTVCCTAT